MDNKNDNVFHRSTHKDSIGFFYKVGDIQTTTPWTRPYYSKIKDFFNYLNENHYELIKNYEIFIIGNILLNHKSTWDLDICIKGEVFEEDKMKILFDLMYDLSLNKFNLLIDLSFIDMDIFDDIDVKVSTTDIKKANVYKISNYIKTIDGVTSKLSINNQYFCNGVWSNSSLNGKIRSKLNNLDNEIIKTKLLLSDFLSMSEIEFENFNI